jgi:protein arginine N-methyltransferase 3
MDDWSDDEDFFSTDELPEPPSDLPIALRRIEHLERKLSQANQDMSEYRAFVGQQFDAGRLAEIVNEPGPSSAGQTPRDDDSHYFSSYSENGTSYPQICPAEKASCREKKTSMLS